METTPVETTSVGTTAMKAATAKTSASPIVPAVTVATVDIHLGTVVPWVFPVRVCRNGSRTDIWSGAGRDVGRPFGDA